MIDDDPQAKLATLDRERRALYESVADARVDTAGLDVDEVVSAAAAALAKVRAS